MGRGRLGRRWAWLAGAALVTSPGCAHSEDEWQAQIRTIGDLKTKLDAEQAAAKKARADLDDSVAKVEQLKQQLRTAGVDVSRLDADLEAQARATEEYRRRSEQLDAARRRRDLLRARLAPLTSQGVSVVVRANRLTLQIPGDLLFDKAREALSREGREALLKIAEVIRSEPTLSSRTYEVSAHVDAVDVGGKRQDALGASLSRARQILALLLQPADKGGGGLAPSRWSAAGHGDADPVRPDDTPEAKQANRRCDIVLLPAPEEALDLRSLAKPQGP
jgi:chemotaxis protein MotB